MSGLTKSKDGLKLEEVLNKKSLEFKNLKIEEDFNLKNQKNRKKLNTIITIIGIILSCLLLGFGIHTGKNINNTLLELNLKIERLNLTENTNLHNYVSFQKYYIVNQTYNETLEKLILQQNYIFLVPLENNENLGRLLVASFIILFIWFLAPFFGFINIIMIFTNYISNNIKISKSIFFISFITFSFNFHTLTILIRANYENSVDPIYFLLNLNLFGLVLFSLKSKIGFKSFVITNIVGLVLEWGLFMSLLLRSFLAMSTLYYLSVNSIIRLLLVIITYRNEYNMRKEFFLNKYLKYEKDYLLNLVDNLTQGFLSYNPYKKLDINKSMRKMINDYKLNKEDDTNSLDNKNRNSYRTEGDYNLLQYKHNLTTKLKINPLNEINNNNSQDDNKIMLEKILSHLTQINSELPEDIQKIIKNELEEGFEMNQFFQNILEKKNILNFDNFILLGIIKIDNTNDSFHNTIKTLQVLFRIITHEYEDDYLEIMFSDVSKIINDEREKTLINARSMYLNKIAHEFRNPLTSLVELSLDIKDEVHNISNIETQYSENKESKISSSTLKISNSIDYSEKLYKTMIHFLKDFSVFSNLKFPCQQKNKQCEKFIKCYQCGLTKMCDMCQVCCICEEKSTQSFEYKLVIDEVLETFNSLVKHEKKNLSIIYSENNSNNLNGISNSRKNIKTNKELFSSAIFNLIFHSYKSAKTKTEIKIKISNETFQYYNSTRFEIINEGFDADQNFLKILKMKEKINYADEINFYSDNSDNEENSNSFNRNFELYISFCILKKLYSNLKIESGKNCCVFSFSIDYIEDEIMLNNLNNLTQRFSSASLGRYNVHNNTNPKISSNSLSRHISTPKISSHSIVKNYPILKNNFSNLNVKSKYSCDTVNMDFLNNPQKMTKVSTDRISLMSNTKEYDKSFNFQYDKLNSNSIGFRVEDGVMFLQNLESDQNNLNININLEIAEDSCEFSADDFYNIKKINKIFRVLLIDDENLIRKTLVRHFNKIQKRNDSITFEIFEATNCFDAINIIYNNCLENKQFDFIIIDECMPFMKGSTLIKLLKQLADEKNLYKINIISHTAFDTVEKKKFIFDCGADHILGKPVEFTHFEDFIIKLI